MAGLPKCSDATANMRATAGDAGFLGTNRARMFTRPGPFWKAAVGQFSKAPKASKVVPMRYPKNCVFQNLTPQPLPTNNSKTRYNFAAL